MKTRAHLEAAITVLYDKLERLQLMYEKASEDLKNLKADAEAEALQELKLMQRWKHLYETVKAIKPPGPPKDGTVFWGRWTGMKYPIPTWREDGLWIYEGFNGDKTKTRPSYGDPVEWWPFTDPTIHPGEPPEEIKNSGVWIEAKYEFTGGGPFVVRFRWVIREWINQDGKYLSDAEVEGFQILAWRIWPPFDVAGE